MLNIIAGDMTFVSTRPEVVRYVEKDTDEMMATLLLPAGVTSKASIEYKNEELLMMNAKNIDDVYINEVLPAKMKYNLKDIKGFSLLHDIKMMFKTVVAIFGEQGKKKNIKDTTDGKIKTTG